MIIKKWVTFEEEVEVEVTVEDIAAALNGSSESLKQVFLGISSMSHFLDGVSDEIIKEINPAQRVLLVNFFEKQVARFADVQGEGGV